MEVCMATWPVSRRDVRGREEPYERGQEGDRITHNVIREE
jgi:hypothetical protein